MGDTEQQITIYDPATNQPITVTVNGITQGSEDGQAVQNIQYITPDGVPVTQLTSSDTIQVGQGDASFQQSTVGFQPLTGQTQVLSSTNFTQGSQSTNLVQQNNLLQSVMQQAQVQQSTAGAIASATSAPTLPAVGNASGTNPVSAVGGSAIPQMLFLNQVTINGQTSFVLVDTNNKPVQLPQGIQVINLPTPQMGGQSIQMPTSDTGDEPLYVNAKQYHRILKRREARAKLESQGKIPKERQKYMYESRHKHALNRVRGCGGIFVKGQDMKEADVHLQNAKNIYRIPPM